jgi:hypothetical protein
MFVRGIVIEKNNMPSIRHRYINSYRSNGIRITIVEGMKIPVEELYGKVVQCKEVGLYGLEVVKLIL